MKAIQRAPFLPIGMVAAVALGAATVVKPQIAFLCAVAALGISALAAPTAAWVAAAVIAAVTFKGLVSVGVLPPVATFMDLPLAWTALLLGLSRQRVHSAFLRRYLFWLGGLALATALAWAFNPSEILRPVVYLMLLGEPFAIAGALIADPPSERMRLVLKRTLLALVILQIPLVALEYAKSGAGDRLQGSLYLAGAGAHVISAVMVVGAIWIMCGGGRTTLGVMRWPVVVTLLFIPFAADAKQVIFALPAIVLASSWRVSRAQVVLRAGFVVGAIVALIALAPAGKASEQILGKAESGKGGKQATAVFLWDKLSADGASLTFGKGPAETVSRAAFMTTDLFQSSGSPLSALGLKPAEIAIEATDKVRAISGGAVGTSADSGTSSTLGVFGDLGIFGLVAYGGLVLTLFGRLRTNASPEGMAAAAGFALFLVLGLVFDWWEQPPFGVFLGTLAGLALADERSVRAAKPALGRQPSLEPGSA